MQVRNVDQHKTYALRLTVIEGLPQLWQCEGYRTSVPKARPVTNVLAAMAVLSTQD